MTQEEMIEKIKDRIEYHADTKKYGYYLGKDVLDYLAADILKDLQIADLTARAEQAEAKLKEAAMPESIEAAAENMFQALCMAPQFTRELMDSVSAFWKLWAEWRGARKEGDK